MAKNRSSRREFVAVLAAIAPTSATPLARPQSSPRPSNLPIYDLDLPPDVLADLESFAQVVIREARWLEELPLDNVDPDFTFIPR